MKKKTIALLSLAFALCGRGVAQESFDYDTLRTNTWSVYAQGGLSWAGGVDMKNENAAGGTNVAPFVGLGVNYNLRPWVRLGLNYEFSKYARQQQFGELQPVEPSLSPAEGELSEQHGGRAYRDMWTHYHNVDLTAEFNIMEIWNQRRCKWFNLYAGTGVGGMFANGNTYDIAMGSERWDKAGQANHYDLHAWVKARNTAHDFAAVYVPVGLSAEFDVLPQLTLGVKAGYKFVFSAHEMSPANVGSAGITVRYNIVGKKQGLKSNKEKLAEALAENDALRAACDESLRACEEERDNCVGDRAAQQRRNRQLADENKRLKAENARLKSQVEDCARRQAAEAAVVGTVQFRFNSATLTPWQRDRLVESLKGLPSDAKLTLVAEATSEGEDAYNQELSERRLAHVVELLKENGIGEERIQGKAIGSSSGLTDASARRVSITIAE